METTKKLTKKNVETIFYDCLFLDGEDTSDAKFGEGAMRTIGFHPNRLERHKAEIAELLLQLPESFRDTKGGGWSFLNACVTCDGVHWGEHINIEQLLTLGIATGQAKMLLPRSMWPALPGGMPYFAVIA